MHNAPPPTRNWWQRNWLWLVLTGCVSLLLLLVLIVAALVAVVMFVLRLRLDQWL